MLYVLALFMVGLMLLAYEILDKDLFTPAFIVCSVFFVSTLACIYNAQYWKTELSANTLAVIVGGCFVFVIISVLCKEYIKNMYGERNADELFELRSINVKTWKIVLIIIINVILMILQMKFVNQVVALSSSGNLVSWNLKMEYYRNVVSYDSSNLHIKVPSYLNMLNKISTIFTYIFIYININNFLANKSKKIIKKFNVLNIAPIVVYLLYNLICATRGSIIQVFISIITVYHLLYHKQNGWKKKYSIKSIAKIIIMIILLLFLFVKLRDIVGRNYSETAKNPLYYICCYIGGSIHLLDDFIKNPVVGSHIWGQETFYSIIRFLGQRLGISDWIYVSHLEFRYSNGLNVGNVYTAFRKYIYDFGYGGVIWCTALVSFLYNTLYYIIKYKRKRKTTFDIPIIFFGYIAYGYFYMSIQEQPLSTLLCTTTLIMPILYMIVIWCLKIKIVLRV